MAKLNLKAQRTLLVLNAPESFSQELDGLEGLRILTAPQPGQNIEFGIAFSFTKHDLDLNSRILAEHSSGDAVIWLAYPKMSSKRYTCEFNRDTGWDVMGQSGFEAVRQVSIDDDWSALRFRRVEFIKTMKRSPSLAGTESGKARTERNRRRS